MWEGAPRGSQCDDAGAVRVIGKPLPWQSGAGKVCAGGCGTQGAMEDLHAEPCGVGGPTSELDPVVSSRDGRFLCTYYSCMYCYFIHCAVVWPFHGAIAWGFVPCMHDVDCSPSHPLFLSASGSSAFRRVSAYGVRVKTNKSWSRYPPLRLSTTTDFNVRS